MITECISSIPCKTASPESPTVGYPKLAYLSDNPLLYYKKFSESVIVELRQYQNVFIKAIIDPTM
jgi:hypothetical protein